MFSEGQSNRQLRRPHTETAVFSLRFQESAINSGWGLISIFPISFLFSLFCIIKKSFAFISFRSLYAHLSYHNRTVLQRLLFSSLLIHMKSASSENLRLHDFTIQFKKKPPAYLFWIMFIPQRAIDRFLLITTTLSLWIRNSRDKKA